MIEGSYYLDKKIIAVENHLLLHPWSVKDREHTIIILTNLLVQISMAHIMVGRFATSHHANR
jgi:hypothetical protein